MKIKKIKWDTTWKNNLLFGEIYSEETGDIIIGVIRKSKHKENNRFQTWYYGEFLMSYRPTSPIYTNTAKGVSPEQRAKDWVEKEFEKYIMKYLEN